MAAPHESYVEEGFSQHTHTASDGKGQLEQSELGQHPDVARGTSSLLFKCRPDTQTVATSDYGTL